MIVRKVRIKQPRVYGFGCDGCRKNVVSKMYKLHTKVLCHRCAEKVIESAAGQKRPKGIHGR